MSSRQPFVRRLVIAFTLMTLVVSGLFSSGIFFSVHFVEKHLMSEEMDRKMDAILSDDSLAHSSSRLDVKTRFYSDAGAGLPSAPWMMTLTAGFHELERGGEAYYAYVRDEGGHRYLLLQEQQEFEAREQALFQVVAVGFLLSVVAACLLGWLLARKVMAPLVKLAWQVRQEDRLLSHSPPLALHYADDEIGHLAAAFDATLRRLHESLERERLFTGDVSHELRTPLMVIAGSCELLAARPLAEREREQVERIARSVKEMHGLVDTFLMLARNDPKDSAFAADATLGQVVEEQCARWAPQIRAKGLDFQVRYPHGGDGNASAYNQTLLGAVLGNLLRNACHYTENGGVILTVLTHGFKVEDSGSGIPEAEQVTVFQPFVRGSGARGEGMGLGLSLVKRICASQGWRISVTSLPAGGCCFQVSLSSS
ncbi:two-component sensor histidine kinase [Alloalcanivorax dieselolei]|uniref:sensor histidine kinase n=1 Tax=Alloalcanivorax dieselolei TaxID=285091 RepID=UPI0005A2AFED|nr:HAMP domain-containing sensor histidine kinase [Alloalcanivorax dieselolei]GGJ77663.1 two-component sensor histidine kinase [Alloalcanivorax dieselolei]